MSAPSRPDLTRALDAALSDFAFPDRDWERDAQAIEARLEECAPGSTDARLLEAPLPVELGEPAGPSATATPLVNSGVRPQSLTDIARRSLEKKQAGEREVARASLAIAARLKPDQAVTAHASPASNDLERASSALGGASGVALTTPLVPARTAGGPRSRMNGVKAGLAVAGIAAAAAAVVLFAMGRSAPPAPLAVDPPRVIGNELAPGAAATHATPSPTNGAREPEPRGVDPDTLAAEAPGPALAAPSAEAALTPPPPAAGAKSVSIAHSEQRAKLANAPARSQLQSSPPTLPADPELRPADSTSTALSARPSTGAVQAALGAVMSGARHCVAGAASASSAVVVFGSDGRVQGVTVSGPAAGKSSAACIEAQLGRARVQPFGAASFSVNTTVRPD